MRSWLKAHPKGSLLCLYVQPGASADEVAGEHDGRLKIKVRGIPEGGKANKAVIEFLSDLTGVSKSRIHLIQGESSRQKQVLVELPLDQIEKLFQLKGLIDL